MIDLNGNEWTAAEANLYAQYSLEIERASNEAEREFLKDQRHRFYLMVSEIYRLEQIERAAQ